MAERGSRVSIARGADRGAARLAEAGCDTPRLDAELLLAQALGVDRARAADHARRRARRRRAGAASRRWRGAEAREPVAYILGRKEFRHIELRSTDGC